MGAPMLQGGSGPTVVFVPAACVRGLPHYAWHRSYMVCPSDLQYMLQGCAFPSIFQDDPDQTCMHGSSRRSKDQPIDLLNGKVNPLSQHAADVLLTKSPI